MSTNTVELGEPVLMWTSPDVFPLFRYKVYPLAVVTLLSDMFDI